MTVPDPAAQAVVAAWRGSPDATAPPRTDPRRVGTVVAVTVVLGVPSALAGVLLARQTGLHHRGHRAGPPDWAFLSGALLFLASGAVLVRSVLHARSRRLLRLGEGSPLRSLTRTERSRAARQLRGREPYGAEQLPLLRVLAVEITGTAWFRSLLPALLGLQLAQVLLHWRQPLAWLFVANSVTFAVVTPLAFRQGATARRFLEDHPLLTP